MIRTAEQARSARLPGDLRGFAFDLDGTIWEGPSPPSRRGRAGRGPARRGARRRVRVELLPARLARPVPSARRPGHRHDADQRSSRHSTWSAKKSGAGWARCRCW